MAALWRRPTWPWLLGLLWLCLAWQPARADSGLYKDFVVLRTAGGSTYYYTYAGFPVPNPAFRNADLGTFDPAAPAPLVLDGAEANTYEGNGAVMMAARLFYRVYPEGTTPGVFSPLELTYRGSGIDGNANNKKWDRTDAGLDLLRLAGASGRFVLEVYFESDVTYAGSTFRNYDSDYGANFRATFTVAAAAPAADTYRAANEAMLANLDKSQIPTGILYDRVFPLARLDVFNQTSADTSSFQHFVQAVQELNTATYRYTGLPTVQALKSRIQAQRQATLIPIGVLHAQFALLDTMAVYDGRLTQADRYAPLYDVPARTASPYGTRTVTVASLLATDVPLGVSSFVLPANLRLDNTNNPVTRVDIDFGDGAGLVTRPLGTPFAATFSTRGVQFVRFVVALSDGTQVTSYGFVNVDAAASAAGNTASRTTTTFPCLRKVPLTNVLPFTDYTGVTQAGRGDVDYYFSDCGTQTKVAKPIIIMDGLDFVDKQRGEDTRDGVGIYSLLEYQNNGPQHLGEEFRQSGYDVVVLNFPGRGGADYIERNAFVLIKLIQETNSVLRQTAAATNRPPEKIVVIGPSMGGLVSRYALTYMEQRYNDASNPATYHKPEWDHNTRLWVAFDSPMLGANVPLGDQRFLKFYSENLEQESATDNLNNLKEPAPRQLLVDHYLGNTGGSTPVGAPGYRDRFQTAITQLGYPELNGLRRISVSNGAQGGVRQFSYNRAGQASGCQEALNFKLRTGQSAVTTLVKLFFGLRHGPIGLGLAALSSIPVTLTESSIHFTPDYGGNCEIYDGRALANGRQSARATGRPSSVSYDVAPGGTRSTQQDIVDSGPKRGDRIPNKFLRFVLAGQYVVPTYTNVVSDHAFIPTVSGFGLTNPNRDLAENLSTRDLVCSAETPFDAYYAPLATNEGHVVITPANALFLKREILQQTPSPVFAGTNSSLCPNGDRATFRVQPECTAARSGTALPTTTYTWATGPGLTLISGQGTPTVVVESQSGFSGSTYVLVQAQRPGAALSGPTIRSLWIGAPQISATYTYNGVTRPVQANNAVGPGTTVINATGNGDAVFQPWVFGDSGGQGAYNTNNNQTGVLTFSALSSVGASVNIKAANGCGQTQIGARFYSTGSGMRAAAMYPNPADGYVEVANEPADEAPAAVAAKGTASAAQSDATPMHVTVYGGQGQVVFHAANVGAPSLRVDTQQWQPGLYQVTIRHGNRTVRRQLSVQH